MKIYALSRVGPFHPLRLCPASASATLPCRALPFVMHLHVAHTPPTHIKWLQIYTTFGFLLCYLRPSSLPRRNSYDNAAVHDFVLLFQLFALLLLSMR